MKIPLLGLVFALSATAACGAAPVNDAGEDAAAWMQVAGLVRATPVRVSPESVVVRMVRPRFPQEMQTAGQPGYVKLQVSVDDEGNVVDVIVLEANERPFAREAMRAVAQWQFLPAEYPQPGVCRVVRVPIEFALIVAAR